MNGEAIGTHADSGRRTVISWDERGRITSIGDAGPGRPDDPILAPAMVDLQVNGFGGHDINAADGSFDLRSLADALASAGTSLFIPTLITAPEDRILDALATIASARAADPELRRRIPFVHIEGPFISPAEGARGAHPLDDIRPPSITELKRWQDASGGLVGMVTLSPHWEEAPAWTAHAVGHGVRVAIGHTDATSSQTRATIAAGASFATHLGNGMASLIPRHPNHVWTLLADMSVSAGFIADGFHLDADVLTAMMRAKGLERAYLVSDSTSLAGMPPGIYETPIGGRVELTPDGRLGVLGTPFLAGSASSLLDCVLHAQAACALSLGEAISLGTSNPARLADIASGSLEVGAAADLVLLTRHEGRPQLASAIIGGKVRSPAAPGDVAR